MEKLNIAILGCGTMGSGMAHRYAENGHSLFLYDHKPKRTVELATALQATPCQNAQEAMQQAEVIILAVKPQNYLNLSTHICQELKAEQLLVSILTGITYQSLNKQFGNVPILRIMPNIAVVYGKGVLGIAENSHLSQHHKQVANILCEPLGKAYWIPEEKLDALTALTGSGPGFAFIMIEAMVDAAIAMGFKADQGLNLVTEMLVGTLSMLKETGKHPGELKWQVTSPNGTTIAGIKALEEAALRAGIMNTFLAAYQRAIALQKV